MKNSRVIQFLETFSAVQLNRFERFVQSPYFNSNTEVKKLLGVLKKAAPEFEEKQVKKERVYARMFPKQAFDEKKLYNLSGKLYQLLREFLVEEHMRNLAFERDYLFTTHALVNQELEKFVPKILKDGETKLDLQQLKDDEYFHQRFSLALLSAKYLLSQDNRSPDARFQLLSDSLDNYYLIAKLKLAVAISSRQLIIADNSIPIVDEASKLYQHLRTNPPPLAELYYLVLQMKPDESGDPYFDQLVSKLKAYEDQLLPSDQNQLYHYGINHCARRYKQGNMLFLRKTFELYQIVIQKDLLFLNPSMLNPSFKNIVTLGLKLEEYEWTETFIREQGKRIPKATRNGVVSYSLANLYFTKGNFVRAQKELIQVEFIDPFFRLNYDMLLIKIFYECQEIEPLFARCEAFAKYIQRNKSLSDVNKEAYGNMARFMRKLAKYRFMSKGKFDRLVDTLESYAHLVERNWLKEKLMELNP